MSVKSRPTDAAYGREGTKLPAQNEYGRGSAEVSGIILAGVHSWGHGALEGMVCRPLLPVAGRPLIEHVITWLRREGISGAVVCANSDTGVLRGSLGDGKALGVSLAYYEDEMPRGPAGCARDAAGVVGGKVFVVAEGAIVPRVDLAKLLEAHHRREAALTVVMAESDSTGERAGSMSEPAGIYLFSAAALEHVPATGYQDIKETLIPRLHAQGKRVVIETVAGGLAPRVTGAASYLAVNMWATQRMDEEAATRGGYTRVEGGWVHRSALVDETARIIGSAVVGPETVVGPEAMIAGPATVGPGCRIEHRSIVSRSAVWGRCTIGASAIVDSSVLADDTHIEPELVVRNTVITPKRRSRYEFVNRLAAYRQGMRNRT